LIGARRSRWQVPKGRRVSTTFDESSVRPVVDRFLKGFNLSRRETEAAVFLAHGLRAKEIAQRMACSEKTVYAHVARVCKKTGCRDYHEVVCMLLAFACHVVGDTPFEHLDHNADPGARGLTQAIWARVPK
jgi:DNA-binding CsgD family transcriptional regulator